ncbi:MAG: putative porin [Pseudomonadota bacterium]
MIKPTKLASLLTLILLTQINAAQADERESLEQLKATTTNLIDLLVQEGVLNKDKADALIKKATADAANQVKQVKAQEANAAAAEIGLAQDEKSVRVQYVPEHIKKEMREEIKKDVMAKLNYKAGERLGLPSWLDRIAFRGDLRLRYQNDSFSDNNAPIAALNDVKRFSNILNSSAERERYRVRARLGADVKVTDWLTGGLQLTTGLLNTPLTPNQTEGIAQGKYQFGLDRAFLKATPTSWLMVEGGRFANPLFSTDLLWDPDLAFDGFAATFKPKFNDSWSSFTTLGAFPIEEVQSSEINKADDKWIYAIQSGIKWQAQDKSSVRLAVGYNDYTNVEGRQNPAGLNSFNGTVPAFRQKGNNTFDINSRNNLGIAPTADTNALASKFEQVNITGQIDLLKFDPVHITLTGDYVKNIGFDQDEVFRRTGSLFKEETDAYQVRLDVGQNSFNLLDSSVDVKKDDWQVSLAYKYVEADSMLDGYTDSNFHLGGTDAKGWMLFANYAIDKNAWLAARYFSTDSISGPRLGIDVFLIDFVAKF